jgi:hypothetical protein
MSAKPKPNEPQKSTTTTVPESLPTPPSAQPSQDSPPDLLQPSYPPQAVVTRPPHPNPVALPHGLETPMSQCPTNLNVANPHHRALVFAAQNPSDYEFGKDRRVIIRATHWLIYPDSRLDNETGEIREFAVVVLIDRNGCFFKTTSATAMKRMQAAVSLFSPEDWERGVPFVITKREGQSGRTYHDIRILVDDEATPVG